MTTWNGALFNGEMIFKNKYPISVQFTCNTTKHSWILTNIYGPCNPEEKMEFIDWFSSIQMPNETEWKIMGDFNFIEHLRTEINLEEMSIKCLFLMRPLAIWHLLKFL